MLQILGTQNQLATGTERSKQAKWVIRLLTDLSFWFWLQPGWELKSRTRGKQKNKIQNERHFPLSLERLNRPRGNSFNPWPTSNSPLPTTNSQVTYANFKFSYIIKV